jgi:hypothetical protein
LDEHNLPEWGCNVHGMSGLIDHSETARGLRSGSKAERRS